MTTGCNRTRIALHLLIAAVTPAFAGRIAVFRDSHVHSDEVCADSMLMAVLCFFSIMADGDRVYDTG